MIEHPLLNKISEIIEGSEPDSCPGALLDLLREYRSGTDYESQNLERKKIAEHFCPGLEYLSWDAVEEMPISFDFGTDYDYDHDGGAGRWRVADHPSLEEQLEELSDEIEIDSLSGSPKLLALKPETDGEIVVQPLLPQDDFDKKELVKSILSDLKSIGIEADPIDFRSDKALEEYLEYTSYRVGRDDPGWDRLIELFEIDPEAFEQDDVENDDQWFPMMNYSYPLPRGVRSTDLWHRVMSCTTVVVIDGEDYLALTGGGMDLTWEICEAYLNCGYWPPAHFAGRLPKMGGRGTSERDRMIINACRVSLRHMAEARMRSFYELDSLEAWSRGDR